MNKKHKKVCTALNYTDHLLILASTITGCISAFDSLINIPIGITGSAIELKICAITARIKKYKSIIKKNKKEHNNNIARKSKLNNIEVLISKTLIVSVIIHDELFLRNNVRKVYNKMKEEIKI